MNTIIRCIITVLMLGALSACTASHQQHYVNTAAMPSGERTAAVLPLVNLTAHPNAGRIVSDILSTELYGLKGYTFLESTAMLESFKGGEEDLEYVLDKTVARRAGQTLGVDTVFYGSVSEFRYKRGLDQSPVVGVNIRMMDVKTGEVVWAASMTESGGCFYGCDTSLNMLTQELCQKAVQELSAAANKQ
ncbi:CsgG/HfaB family protein [Desulfovibrio mangrovi]|uniref:GNA1162 family protein n=1 Tax=Desulfovibrio mangrovi TaxID=2976983 RepID=UPI002247A1F0|nr:GNA1162 family protein [Desulfovibrio mangrovi]UZP67401.1 CsgG/HfaB family protein [Desulfovibrio mangrovi]